MLLKTEALSQISSVFTAKPVRTCAESHGQKSQLTHSGTAANDLQDQIAFFTGKHHSFSGLSASLDMPQLTSTITNFTSSPGFTVLRDDYDDHSVQAAEVNSFEERVAIAVGLGQDSYTNVLAAADGFGSNIWTDSNDSLRCDRCNKTFTRPSSVVRHQASCMMVSLIPCELCDQTFSRADNLKAHMQRKHGVGPSLDCSKCGVHFRSKIKLEEHMVNCGRRK